MTATRTHRLVQALLITFATCGAFLCAVNPAAHAATQPPVQTHGQDGQEINPGDVYVLRDGSLVNPSDQTPPEAALYNVAGASMRLTWGQWQTASATSATVVARYPVPKSYVAVSLNGLIPNGVYSLFYVTFEPDSTNPYCPTERGVALPSILPGQRPDAASFVADASGRARFLAAVNGALLDPVQLQLQLVYHLTGKTYGALPNSGESLTQGPNCRGTFGDDAMRQLLILAKWT